MLLLDELHGGITEVEALREVEPHFSREEGTRPQEGTFTIVIPAFNEEKRIGPTLDGICNYIRLGNLQWKVIVSMDGSDHTGDIVESYSREFSFVTGVRAEGRSGKGQAIKRVLDRLDSDFVILMDADGGMSLETIANNLGCLESTDVLIFSRYSNGNKIPFLRTFLSGGFNVLVRASFGLRVRDTQSGYKVFRTEPFVAALRRVAVTDFFFDVALLSYLRRKRVRMMEIKSHYTAEDGSKVNSMREVVGMGVSLIAFRVRHSRFYKFVPSSLVELYYRKFRWM